MKTNETSTRELAMKWWNKLPRYDMDKSCKEIYSQMYYERQAYSLTGREIEEIWTKEVFQKLTPSQADFVDKPNQKQFKEFSPELFKAYISKFSKADQIKARDILDKTIKEQTVNDSYSVKFFIIGDKVRVIRNGANASDFSKIPLGVYSIGNWKSTVFVIAGDYKPITFDWSPKCYGAYPLRLVNSSEIIGYVYNEAIKKI